MKAFEIKSNVYWVGGIDWRLRNFHGYTTQRGTTYNAYLICDEKNVLIDTVKHYLSNEMISRIKTVIDPEKIDYVISNHVEMDHSGSLQSILDLAPKATIITSPRGEKGLRRHYKQPWTMKTMQSGETLNIGHRTLQFIHIPMVHWPDSMVTYSAIDKLLLPNDAFGQHIASPHRFDDEIGWEILKEEAAKYYANIVMPYADQVKKALQAVSSLSFDMIAPSHGVIWRHYINDILREYTTWSNNETKSQALIIYDTMWGTTEKIAYTLADGIEKVGIPVTIRNLKTSDLSDIITDVLTSRLILFGTPTLNNGMLPTMSAFLTYLKGLRPRNRIGFFFNSYGWAGQQTVKDIETVINELGWDIPFHSVSLNFIPDDQELSALVSLGEQLGNYLKK